MECQIRRGSGLTSRGRLARIDVADNDHVDVHLFFTATYHRWISKFFIGGDTGERKMMESQDNGHTP